MQVIFIRKKLKKIKKIKTTVKSSLYFNYRLDLISLRKKFFKLKKLLTNKNKYVIIYTEN